MSFRSLIATAAAVAAIARPLHAQGKIDLPISMAELEKRVKADSNDPAAHYNVSLAYWNARRWDDVEHQLREAIKLDPRFAEAHLALAYLPYVRHPNFWSDLSQATKDLVKEMQKEVDESDHEYRHAFLINPMVDMRIVAAAIPRTVDFWDVRDAMGDIMALYYQGKIDCAQGQYVECEAKFTRLLADLKDARNPYTIPGDVYWYQGLAGAHEKHFDLAVKDFQLLIDREAQQVKKVQAKGLLRVPLKSNEYRYFIATFDNAAGKPEEAERLFREALENDLGLYIAHVRLAEIYEAKKDFAKAVDERRNAVSANPDDASLNVDLGITLGRAGRFPEAVEALKSASEALPRSTEAWYWLGIAYQQVGQPGPAKGAFEKVVAVAPSRFAGRIASAKQHLAALP